MAKAARISDLLDLRWAQLASPHARHLLLAAAECHRFQPIPHRLLQRATRLEPQAYRAASSLVSREGRAPCESAPPAHHPWTKAHGRHPRNRIAAQNDIADAGVAKRTDYLSAIDHGLTKP
jgi:hypothetical protein